MAREKMTSLRILQHKKKPLAPLLYALIGFIAGLIVSTLIFLFLINNFNFSSIQTSLILNESEKKQIHPPITVHTPWVDDIDVDDQNASLLGEDHHFIQPKDKDLNKFFERPTSNSTTANDTPSNITPTPPAQQVAPFENSVQHPVKRIAKVEKINPTTTKSITAISEAETATPKATLKITVIQRPLAIKEDQ
ncbi:MAG: hypothetical protein Q4F77_02555 [Acinetobacter sp.]|uniref:hypothetical protein n=1 Tax=Acinetobacter sp. TaxID=472 RepID=UPI0026E0D805|nr:hypothetical protein [Acinetobacter sp.]MDO5542168.1 hypothetical protein [Acinetobacter sp.]